MNSWFVIFQCIPLMLSCIVVLITTLKLNDVAANNLLFSFPSPLIPLPSCSTCYFFFCHWLANVMCYNKLFLTSICRKPAFQCIPWQRYVHCLRSSIQMDNRSNHHSVSINKYFNINKYNLFTVDKIIHRVLPWLRMLAVKLQLIEIEGTLWVEGIIYFSLLFIFGWHFLYKASHAFL